MLLTLDIGNTEITAGLFRGDAVTSHWRLTTNPDRTPDEWGRRSAPSCSTRATRPTRCARQSWRRWRRRSPRASWRVRTLTSADVRIVDATSPLPIRLDVDEPLTVGADRIINTLAAVERFRTDTIVVDFGTATTFDCITGDGRFIGGVIMPGLRTSSDQLTRRAAKLPATELRPPARVIGRRTEECIRAGVLLGTADAVDGLVRRIQAEWPTPTQPKVVATGGLAGTIVPLCRTVELIDPDLTLHGLRLAAGYLGVKW